MAEGVGEATRGKSITSFNHQHPPMEREVMAIQTHWNKKINSTDMNIFISKHLTLVVEQSLLAQTYLGFMGIYGCIHRVAIEGDTFEIEMNLSKQLAQVWCNHPRRFLATDTLNSVISMVQIWRPGGILSEFYFLCQFPLCTFLATD